jgi:hypothetical protein
VKAGYDLRDCALFIVARHQDRDLTLRHSFSPMLIA